MTTKIHSDKIKKKYKGENEMTKHGKIFIIAVIITVTAIVVASVIIVNYIHKEFLRKRAKKSREY